MTTNQEEFIECSYDGLPPITYTKKSAPKNIIDENELYKADKNSFNGKIGMLTNLSTTMYSFLPLYPDETKEHDELIKRLKLCRKEQGNQIDKAKGILVKPFPENWTKWTRITDDMTPEEKEIAEFNNKLLVDKRPYFMRYLYPNYNKDYLQLRATYDNYCVCKFGYDFDAMKNKPEHSEYEQRILQGYNRFVPLLDSDCVMNKICHYMEDKCTDIKSTIRNTKRFDSNLLKDADIPIDIVKLDKMYDLYREYARGRKNHHTTSSANRFEGQSQTEFVRYIERKSFDISSDICELANLAVHVCYDLYPGSSKDFVWRVFGDGLIENIRKNSSGVCAVPMLDADGEMEFMGKRYGMKDVCIN
jgi:hypothetical protein